MEVIQESELVYIGDDSVGEASFINIKEELRDWSKILAPFAPAISLLIAYLLKGKKR